MPSRVADILLEAARQQGELTREGGRIWGGAVANLGQIPAEVMAQRDLQRQRELQATRLGLEQQRLGLETQVTQAGLRKAQRQEQEQYTLDQIYNSGIIKPDGTMDLEKASKGLMVAQMGHLVPAFHQQASQWNDEALKRNQTRADQLGMQALGLQSSQYDPGMFHLFTAQQAKTGLLLQDDADMLVRQATTPEAVKQIVDRWILGSPSAQRILKGERVTGKPGEVFFREDPLTGALTKTGEVGPDPRVAETTRHNQEMERIDLLKFGRSDAAQKETARHNAAMEKLGGERIVVNTERAANKLVKVEHQDSSGKTVIEWLPESEVRGQTFKKGVSGAVETRLASAEAVKRSGDDIIAKLRDPAVAAQLGPAMGRVNTLREFLGNPPPALAELAGAIESFSLANMGVHGMRSVQGANQISALLDRKHTPASLIATINGLMGFTQRLMETEGREVPPPPSSTTPKPTHRINPVTGKIEAVH